MANILSGLGQAASNFGKGFIQGAVDSTGAGMTTERKLRQKELQDEALRQQEEVQRQQRQQQFQNDFAMFREIQDPQAKAEAVKMMQDKYPDKLSSLQALAKKAAFSAQNKPAQEKQAQEKSEQEKQADQVALLKDIAAARKANRLDDLSNSVIDKDVEAFLSQKAKDVINPPKSAKPSPQSTNNMASTFNGGVKGVIDKTLSRPQYPNNRNMFSGGVNPYPSQRVGPVRQQGQGQAVQSPAASTIAPQALAMPSNKPSTFADLGIADRGAQQLFSEVEKVLPDKDVRSAYKANPQDFEALFTAVKTGKITKQKAIELIKKSLE